MLFGQNQQVCRNPLQTLVYLIGGGEGAVDLHGDILRQCIFEMANEIISCVVPQGNCLKEITSRIVPEYTEFLNSF